MWRKIAWGILIQQKCEPGTQCLFSLESGAHSLPLDWVTLSQNNFSMKPDTSSIQPRIQPSHQNSVRSKSAKAWSHPLRLWEGPDFPFPVAPSRTECCLIPIMHKLIQYHPTSLDHFELILIFLSERKIFFHLPLAKCLRVNMSAKLVATYLQNYCRGMWLWSQGRPCTWGIFQGAVLFLIPLYRLLRQSS